MRSLEIKRQMNASSMQDVSALIEDAWRADGTRPLNDHLWLDLRDGGRAGFAGIIAREPGRSHLIGYCQVSRGNESWALDLIVHPHYRYDSLEIAPELMKTALDVVASEGGGHVHWWVFEPNKAHRHIAEAVGLRPGRRLLQMRRPLPLDDDVLNEMCDFDVEPFQVGHDEQQWLNLNNAAFARHPDQGGWTMETLQSRMKQDWFDPSGFVVHRRDGQMACFCWTKIHRDSDEHLGEIYVIAVDPTLNGLGLGRKIAIAGLRDATQKGARTAMLYVDAENTSAMAMYTKLGFSVHHEEHSFIGDVASSRGVS
ncbi:MAG: acetyltransferase MshD [Actinomycetota bacterium]